MRTYIQTPARPGQSAAPNRESAGSGPLGAKPKRDAGALQGMEAKTGFHFFFLVYISSKGVRGLGSDRFQGLDTISLVLGNSNKAPGQARHSLLDSFTSPDHLYLPPPLSPTLHWINLCITVNLFVRIKVAKDNHENALTKNNFSHHQRSIVLLLFAKHSLSQFELFPVRIIPSSNKQIAYQ